MTLVAFGVELLTSQHDAGELFRADPGRLIGLAVADLHRVRPLVRTTSCDLLNDEWLTGCYRVPVDFVAIQQAH